MRVVGGRFRGRALAAPKSQAIRPTADRLRESLFNILIHAYDDPIAEARVLDLFAGTGALGIEAISRGAAFALFVDDGAEARAFGKSILHPQTNRCGCPAGPTDAQPAPPPDPPAPPSEKVDQTPGLAMVPRHKWATVIQGGWYSVSSQAMDVRAAQQDSVGRMIKCLISCTALSWRSFAALVF